LCRASWIVVVPLNRDQELWACALAAERLHGEGAFLHAAVEIDRLYAEGEREAAGVWREVLKRIEALEGRQMEHGAS
jgi:hypothetical protein